MKKVIILLGAAAAALLPAILVSVFHGPAFVSFAACLVSLGLLAAGMVFCVQQGRFMKHLIEESRKRNRSGQVHWEEEDAQELQLVRRRVELSVLQKQINPHFLYNTLDSIRSRALMDGQEEIAKMTEILSRFFRYCISNSDNLVRVREELKHIEDYFYIQKYRFEERFDMEIKMEQEDIYDLYLPKMTLQPLVENAMIHGLEKKEHKGQIQIRLMRTETKLMIVVSDNGVGMSQEALIRLNERIQQQYLNASQSNGRSNGIALNNVNVRLKITFGEDSGIRYRSMEGEGTDAVVTLPIVDVFTRVKYENQYER